MDTFDAHYAKLYFILYRVINWFDRIVTLDALELPTSPGALFHVMSVAKTNAVQYSLGQNVLGLPELKVGGAEGPQFDFTTQDQKDAARIYQFCRANSFQFFANLQGKPFRASLFNDSEKFSFRKIKHGFVAQIGGGRWVEVGQYNTSRVMDMDGEPVSLGSGFAYARIVMKHRHLPYMRLDSKLQSGMRGSGQISDSLEGNFNQIFDVHVADNAQTNLRYILTPDVMAELLDIFHYFDIEIVNGCLFMIMPAVGYWEAKWMEYLLKRIESLNELFDQRLANYSTDDDRIVAIEPNSYEKMLQRNIELDRFDR